MNFDLLEFWASMVIKNKYEPTKISLTYFLGANDQDLLN